MKTYIKQKSITYLICHSAVILALVLVVSPIIVSAQTAPVQDGATDWGATRQQRISGYRHQSSDLQQKISALPTTANPVVIMPVLFGVAVKDISPNFGDPRSGGRTHEGEDIMAVKGTPIVSPTPAVVLRMDNGVSEGITVYTANPGGETFVYMHLDHFAEGLAIGNVVQTGALLGYVGNTGNASGGAAHLHFEIHNTSGTPTDPFPRLTGEFSLQDKITYLTTILGQATDSTALANLLVTNFRKTFTDAVSLNMALPNQITLALASIPAGTVPSNGNTNLPTGDLDIGSSGSLVVALQQYLIQANSGPATKRLALAGATGNFGSITATALVEYQTFAGISPANGYYGIATRTYIAAHPLTTTNPASPVNPPANSGALVQLYRSLSIGMVGEDVRTLQKILNARGFTVATTGAGSLGNESTYFGPATRTAVMKFQTARNISPIAGYVGPVTRNALGSL